MIYKGYRVYILPATVHRKKTLLEMWKAPPKEKFTPVWIPNPMLNTVAPGEALVDEHSKSMYIRKEDFDQLIDTRQKDFFTED